MLNLAVQRSGGESTSKAAPKKRNSRVDHPREVEAMVWPSHEDLTRFQRMPKIEQSNKTDDPTRYPGYHYYVLPYRETYANLL